MRIACLQFAPELGQTESNVERADKLLAQANTDNLNILVLPELAFTGYNFPSLSAIEPHLEPTAAGISTQWALKTARRLNCIVSVGYPEKAEPFSLFPSGHFSGGGTPITQEEGYSGRNVAVAVTANPYGPPNFNSTVAVSPDGQVLMHYRKTFLYYTDAVWARPGSGFYFGKLPVLSTTSRIVADDHDGKIEEIKVAAGICMDLNPHNFTAPWTAYEFANHIISTEASMVLVNMAWLSHDLIADDLVPGSPGSRTPDLHTLGYWVERLSPLIGRDNRQVIMVLANRAGIEGEACYAGTSTIMRVGNGRVGLFGVMGKGEEGVLIADINEEPKFLLRQKGMGGGGDNEDENASS